MVFSGYVTPINEGGLVMDFPQALPDVSEAMSRQCLRRMVAPLLRAGWSEVEFETWEDELEALDPNGYGSREVVSVVELERSKFHLRVSWEPASRTLTLDDPTDSWDWVEGMPPLCPVDAPLSCDLSSYSSLVEQSEVARRMFAAEGLLDATRIAVPQEWMSLLPDLRSLLLSEQLCGTAEQQYGEQRVREAFASINDDDAWRLQSGLRTHPLIAPAPVPAAAAMGIVEWCWRRETVVEDWHRKVTDEDMARANIAATRAVLAHVHLDGVDWPAVRAALTHPHRRIADGRALSDLFEEGWLPILSSIHGEIDKWEDWDDKLGPQTVLRLLTIHGSHTESVGDWWGSGSYETLVRRVILKGAESDQLPAPMLDTASSPAEITEAVVHNPDLLDDHSLSWLGQAIFEETLARRSSGEPHATALILPDWAAIQLDDLLDPSNE